MGNSSGRRWWIFTEPRPKFGTSPEDGEDGEDDPVRRAASGDLCGTTGRFHVVSGVRGEKGPLTWRSVVRELLKQLTVGSASRLTEFGHSCFLFLRNFQSLLLGAAFSAVASGHFSRCTE